MEQNTNSIMNQLLENKQYFNLPKVGDLTKGTVISVDKNEVHIDLGGIATGVVRGKERYDESDEYKGLKPGDIVEATVLEMENENGEIELSFQYAGRQKSWQTLKDLIKSGEIVQATITEANKGGLLVKLESIAGFLPVSQLSPEHYPRVPGGDKNRILEILKSYVGKKFDVKVFDANEAEDKLIVSEKSAWEETQKDVIGKYKVGMTVEGTVTAVTDFGVFVEFSDKLEGLIHISEIAWQRIDNPHDFVKVGQKVKAEIIGIENSKIFLSMKKLANDPWEGIEKKYKVGQKVEGAVIKVNPFGLFVELEKNIQGLAHISQLNEKQAANIGEVAKIGENKEFYVVSIDPKNHRLGLSLTKPKAEKETKAEIAEVSGDSKENTSSEEAPKEEKKRGRKKKEEAAETIATETEAEPLKQAE
ncbi:MAG: 30S ribosomal protein S1 [bacterium ADurb.BinA186]|nr:MAG: 30S ribosomal protein S1 [bacterium ADurb.BinA186]